MIGFLAAIIALAPIYLIRFHVFTLPTTLLEVMIVAFLIATGLRLKVEDLRKIKNLRRINYAVCLFVIAGIISTIVSPEPIKALGQLKAFIVEPILIFYVIIINVKTKSHQLTILRALFFASVLVSLFGIFQYYSFIHLPIKFWGTGSEVERITSVFEHPNALSLYLAPLFGLFAALWLYDYPLSKNKWYSAIGLLTMVIALLLTFSRGAWMAVTIATLALLIKKYGLKKILLPSMIFVLILIFIPSINQRLSLGVTDSSSAVHFDLMKIGLKKIAQSPILGNGLAGFRTTLADEQYTADLNIYPHNIILNFWVEMGILGLISFIWIIILAFRQYKNAPHTVNLAAGVFLAILLIHGLVDTPYFKNDLSLLFWFAISLFYL